MNGPTRHVERSERLVYCGRTPDGRALYRPLQADLDTHQRLGEMYGRPWVEVGNGRKPPAPFRPAVAPPRTAPRWFWGGVLVLLTIALAFGIWLVMTIAGVLAAALGWVIGNAVMIVGFLALGTFAGLVFGVRRGGVTMIQSYRGK